MLATRVLDVANEPLEQDFEKLFHEHYPLIYRTAYSVTGNSAPFAVFSPEASR
jgi:DNA-directed RNA polymerase specialized sigma24 family protein